MPIFKLLVFLVAGLSLVSSSIVKRQSLFLLNPNTQNDVTDMQYPNYLVLVKETMSTQCEVAILGENIGLVAANCIEWDTSGQGTLFGYSVANVQPTTGTGDIRKVTRIIRHPSYDATTFANNLAYIEFESIVQDGSWMWGYIADDPNNLLNRYFTYRSLSSISPLQGDKLNAVASMAPPIDLCKEYSPLYAAHPDDYVCNTLTVGSVNSPGCVTGYSSIYGAVENMVAIHALYSFSVSDESTGLCSATGHVINYYTILRNYLPWFASIAGKSFISIHSANMPYVGISADKDFHVSIIIPAIVGKVAVNGLNLQVKNVPKPLSSSLLPTPTTATLAPSTTAIPPPVTSTILTAQSDTTTIEVTETVTTSSTEFISTTTVNTISTTEIATATATSTVTNTESTMLTSVIGATSMDIATSTTFITTTFSDTILFTATVTDTVTAPIVNTVNPQGNNINIGLNVDQENATTVTVTTTQTVSSVSTITDTSVLSLTTTLFLSDSNIPQQANTVVPPASTITSTNINMVTVTTESTTLITSLHTVTYVPSITRLDIVQTTVSGVTTVTQTVPNVYMVTVTQTVTSKNELGPLATSSESSPIAAVAASDSNMETVAANNGKKFKMSAGLIAGLSILALVLLAGLWYFFFYKGKRDSQTDGYTNQQPGGMSRVRRWLSNNDNGNDRYARSYSPGHMAQIH